MLIPLTSAKIAWWHRMLVGNKKKGVQFLSNVMYIEPWAKEAIDDGGLVTVAYDVNTPNRAELIAVIEAAGYAERAAMVILMLQLGLNSTSDWETIVANENLISIIWGNLGARTLVFETGAAMIAVANSSVARNTLFANSAAVKDMWSSSFAANTLLSFPAFVSDLSNSSAANTVADNAILMDSVRANEVAVNNLITNTQMLTRILESTVAMNSLFGHQTSWSVMETSTNARTAIVASRAAMSMVGKSRIAMKGIFNNSTWRNAIVASANALDGLNDVASVYSGANSPVATGAVPKGNMFYISMQWTAGTTPENNAVSFGTNMGTWDTNETFLSDPRPLHPSNTHTMGAVIPVQGFASNPAFKQVVAASVSLVAMTILHRYVSCD